MSRLGLSLEARKQVEIAWPMVVTSFITYAIVVVSIMFVGHLGVLELSSSAFANSIGNITGVNVLIGLGSALETLCGQAFGAKRYKLLGIYLQASILLLTITAVPISVLWWNIGPLLTFLGQNPTVVSQSVQYLRSLIPALFATAIIQPVIKYLQSQSLVVPMMVCSVITFLIHIPLAYLLVVLIPAPVGGFRGGAVAVDLSYWIFALLLVSYACRANVKTGQEDRTWPGFSTDALAIMWPVLRLAIPSTFMLCVQYWAFEFLTFLSGLLPDPELELSFLSICLNTAALLATIPFGLGAAASTRVSNELGAGNPNSAKSAMNVSLRLSAIQVAVISTSLLVFGKYWVMAFSDDPDVIDYITSAMPFVALNYLFDSAQFVMAGVARGSARQDFAAILSMVSFNGIGIPCALLFCFVFHLNARGLFIGCLTGLIVYAVVLCVIVYRSNWEKLSQEAQTRATEAQEPLLLPSSAETLALP